MDATGIFYVFLHVSDLARSKQFYADAVGWTLNTDTPEVGGFMFGSGYLVIRQDDRPDDQRSYGGGQQVAVLVDDVGATHRQLADAGVEVSAVADQHWGERNFSFQDPDGYTWVVGKPTTEVR